MLYNKEGDNMLNYETLELDKNGIMLKLPLFYSRYAGCFFFYQAKKANNENDPDEPYFEYYFHLNKCDATEKDERGNLLPILMCHITDSGMLPCPDEILRDIKSNNDVILCYGNGFSDFILSTHELATGLNAEDEELIIKLFNNS